VAELAAIMCPASPRSAVIVARKLEDVAGILLRLWAGEVIAALRQLDRVGMLIHWR
jgi:hypothetical protein